MDELLKKIVSHKHCDISFEKIDFIIVSKNNVSIFSSSYAQDSMGGRQPLFNLGCKGVREGYTINFSYKTEFEGVLYKKDSIPLWVENRLQRLSE